MTRRCNNARGFGERRPKPDQANARALPGKPACLPAMRVAADGGIAGQRIWRIFTGLPAMVPPDTPIRPDFCLTDIQKVIPGVCAADSFCPLDCAQNDLG